MAFRDNLKRLRIAAGLNQEQLGLRVGGGQSLIANYEAPMDRKGSRSPDIDKVPLIAEALGVQVQELFGEPPSRSQPVGLTTETVAAAIDWLREFIVDTRSSETILTDPIHLSAALELVVSVRAGQPEIVATRNFAAKIEAARKDRNDDERRAAETDNSDGVGVPKRRVAKQTSSPAGRKP